MSKVALIDGDVLCYLACKPRWEEKVVDGISKVSIDDEGNIIPLEFTVEENRLYLEQSWNNFKRSVDKLVEELYCDSYMMAVKAPTNFRDDLFYAYKANRKRRSGIGEFVPAIRNLAVMEDMAVFSDGREADDFLCIWANELKAAKQEFIVCSIDKDLLMIPGQHWNLKKKTLVTITEEQGSRNFYEQLLKGDPTDNIPGIPGIGKVKAARLLEGASDIEAFQEVVVENYLMAFGAAEWLDQLLINGKLLYLQKNLNDYFDCEDWALVNELR